MWWLGTAWLGAGRAGVVEVNGARQLLDSVSACGAPAIEGKVRGLGRGGRAGEGLGDTCELQDRLLHGFMALGNMVGMWLTCDAMAA